MNEHIEHVHHDELPAASNEVVVDSGSRFPRISWGAVFAGLVVTLGLSWLLHLLGAAIGVSIEDASDTIALEDGVTGGAAVWLLLSWLVSFFVGSLVAARLAGSLEDFTGMLHGLVLWGTGTLVAVYLGYVGITSMLQTGTQLASATASAVAQTTYGVGSALASGTQQAVKGVSQAMDTTVVNAVQNQLRDSAIQTAATMDEQLSEQDIRSALNSIDARTLRRVTQDLIDGDQEGAAQLLASSTDLSEQDAQALINGAYEELEQRFGNPDNRASLAEDLENQMARQVDSYVAQLDAQGGPEVTAEDVRTAIDELDYEVVSTIAMRLASGDAAGAKRALAANTNLTKQQIDDIYTGAEQGIQEEIDTYLQEIDQAAETISTYVQEVMWLTFAGSALALAVSLGGGWLGADSARRVYTAKPRYPANT